MFLCQQYILLASDQRFAWLICLSADCAYVFLESYFQLLMYFLGGEVLQIYLKIYHLIHFALWILVSPTNIYTTLYVTVPISLENCLSCSHIAIQLSLTLLAQDTLFVRQHVMWEFCLHCNCVFRANYSRGYYSLSTEMPALNLHSLKLEIVKTPRLQTTKKLQNNMCIQLCKNIPQVLPLEVPNFY